MKMNGRSLMRYAPAFAGLLLAILLAAPADAALLRGRLERADGRGHRIAAPGVTVTVYNKTLGRSVAVVTDAHGMYHLNVRPGSYWLEVWVSRPARVYQINVAEPYTDIPPILL